MIKRHKSSQMSSLKSRLIMTTCWLFLSGRPLLEASDSWLFGPDVGPFDDCQDVGKGGLSLRG